MECNICFNSFSKTINKKLIKCDKCSFMCCISCISNLNNLELHYDKISYNCCVCRENNYIKIKDIKDINIVKSLYQKQTIKLSEIQNDPVVLCSIVLFYNAPVISNDKVNYYNNTIIALRTYQDNNSISLELYDRFNQIDFNHRLRQFNENNIQLKNYFIYSTDDFDFTLLKHSDFYELCSNGVIDFV